MIRSPPPPPPHATKYSQHPLNIIRPASTQREPPKDSRSPFRPPVLCPIVVGHNAKSIHAFVQDSSTSGAYTRPQNTNDSAHSLDESRTLTPNTPSAAHSSTLCSNGGSPKPHHHHHHVCRNSSDLRILSGNRNRNAPTSNTSSAAQNPASYSNSGSPTPLTQANMSGSSPPGRIPIVNSNLNSYRPLQYTKFHHPLPPVPRTLSSPTCESRQGPSEPNICMKRQPHTPFPANPLPIVPSAFSDATFIDKHTLRHTLPPSSTHSETDTIEASTTACGLQPVVRTESVEARVGEYGLLNMDCLSQHSERDVKAEIPRRVNEVPHKCDREEFQKCAATKFKMRAEEEFHRHAGEETQRRTDEAVQCLAEEEVQRWAEEEDQRHGEERVEAAWNQKLPRRDAAWWEGVECRQDAEIVGDMADTRATDEARALRQKTANSRIQGPRQKTIEPKPKPRFSGYILADAVLVDSSKQRRREEWTQRGDELRRRLEQTEHEVWGDEDARITRREEEARRKKVAKSTNQATALRAIEEQASRQRFPQVGTELEFLDLIPPNAPILDRDKRRRIADAIRDGYPLLARSLEEEVRRSQYPMNMTFNGDGSSVNIHNVHVTFQGRAARRAARMAEGRNSWRERAEEMAYEWCCTVM